MAQNDSYLLEKYYFCTVFVFKVDKETKFQILKPWVSVDYL